MVTKTRKRREMPRREEFLEAALRRFSRDGFAASSTRDICSDLGLVPSAIYNYFPSKESVLLAIEQREMLQIQAGLEALLSNAATSPALERLRIGLRFMLMNAIHKREAWRLMADMLRSLSSKNKTLVIARRDKFQTVIRQLIEDAIRAGDLVPQDTHLSTLYLFGVAEGISGWYTPRGLQAPEAIVDHAETFCLRALNQQVEHP